jgi:CSLREA domain-containing protein
MVDLTRSPYGWFFRLLLVATAMVLGLFRAHPTSADTAFTVNNTGDAVDANIGDGLCRTAANKCTLRAAIQEANANPDHTTITLKDKVYKIKLLGTDEDASATGDYDISSPITIVGVTPAVSVIDANFLDRAFHLHMGGSLSLSNLTVRNGFSDQQGGAIMAQVSDVAVYAVNVIFRGNTAEATGGAISLTSGAILEVGNSKFINNLSVQGGALYFNEAGHSTILNSLFDDNSGEFGGAIATYLTTLTVEDTRFEDNLAECYLTPSCDPLLMEGGAFYAGNYDADSGGNIILFRTGFHRNASSGWGGGFSIYNAQLAIDESTFDSNYAVQGSGAGYTFGTDGTIAYSSFTNNVAEGANSAGGAVYFQDSALTVSASTFSGNSAFSGGGIYVSGDAPPRSRINDTLLQHVTIVNNSATDGGGLWLVTGSGGLTVVGSIIQGNVGTNLGSDCGGATITMSWTLISDDTHCTITGTNNLVNQSTGLEALSYGINGTTLGHVPMMASPVLGAETVCSIVFDQHYNFMPANNCTLGAVSGTYRNLLLNESFESGISGWKVTSADKKDKVVNKPAYTGSRAFAFTGVAGKTSVLRQTVVGGILGAMQSGQTVCASAMLYTKNVNKQALTIRILVKYSDGVTSKSSQPVLLTAGEYSQSCSGVVTLDLTGGRMVTKVEARITSKSTGGKTFVDNVSASWDAEASLRSDGATRAGAEVLGLPDAPNGFRR